jgi:DNA-binding CsgD family transcriptional regulator
LQIRVVVDILGMGKAREVDVARHSELQHLRLISESQPEFDLLESVSSALYDLNRHRDRNSLPEKILAVVSRLISCDSAMFVRIDAATKSFSLISQPAFAFAELNFEEVAELHVRDHPLIAHFASRRDARAWNLYDLVSRVAFQGSALYRSLYRPLGIEFQLILLVPYPDRAPRVLVLNRRVSPFSETDRRLLQLLWPHIAQAVRNAHRVSRAHSTPDLDLHALGRGVLVLDGAGHVELCTEQARIWLLQYYLGNFSQREIKSLPRPIADWIAQTLDNRLLYLRGIADPIAPLIVRRGNKFLAIKLIADYGRGKHLLLMDEISMSAPPDLLLAQGLTKREAEVLAWVAQGKTNAETAIILGLSVRTVQKHLEHVFAKLGVETRTSATFKAWQVARFAALAGDTN